MKITIIGAGRMGIRHAQGCASNTNVSQIFLVDINELSLENAKKQLESISSNIKYAQSIDTVDSSDILIIATTAADRIETLNSCVGLHPKYILLEKPVAQSYEEFLKLKDWKQNEGIPIFINHNMRNYDFVKNLKYDLHNLNQLLGFKYINYNGGALGIGANGIHYLDLLFYLFDADEGRLIAGEIGEEKITSGRGPQFSDFGGWAAFDFFKGSSVMGKSILTLNNTSSVFGGWDIIGHHGRIRINEIEGTRVDILRKRDSSLPVFRYAADYEAPVTNKIETPFLSTLTSKWIDALTKNEFILPDMEEAEKSHKLMYEWLALSKVHKSFPIT